MSSSIVFSSAIRLNGPSGQPVQSLPRRMQWQLCALLSAPVELQTNIQCTLIIEEVTKDTCRQTLEGVLDIKVGMGLGQTAERVIVKQLTKVYKSIPIVVEK